jgi:hypothetical protein
MWFFVMQKLYILKKKYFQMKTIKTFEQFVNEEITPMNKPLQTIGNKEQNRKDVNDDRNKTPQQKSSELDKNLQNNKKMKIDELEQVAKGEQERLGNAGNEIENIKNQTVSLAPDPNLNPNAAKNFKEEQKQKTQVVSDELKTSQQKRDLVRKQVDNIKKNF